jgi:hypothetical protein
MSLRSGLAVAQLGALALALATATACGGASSTSAVEPPPSALDAGAVADGGAPADPTGGDASGSTDAGAFAVTSAAFVDQGALPVTFTCDGAGTNPPLAWTTPPRAEPSSSPFSRRRSRKTASSGTGSSTPCHPA